MSRLVISLVWPFITLEPDPPAPVPAARSQAVPRPALAPVRPAVVPRPLPTVIARPNLAAAPVLVARRAPTVSARPAPAVWPALSGWPWATVRTDLLRPVGLTGYLPVVPRRPMPVAPIATGSRSQLPLVIGIGTALFSGW